MRIYPIIKESQMEFLTPEDPDEMWESEVKKVSDLEEWHQKVRDKKDPKKMSPVQKQIFEAEKFIEENPEVRYRDDESLEFDILVGDSQITYKISGNLFFEFNPAQQGNDLDPFFDAFYILDFIEITDSILKSPATSFLSDLEKRKERLINAAKTYIDSISDELNEQMMKFREDNEDML